MANEPFSLQELREAPRGYLAELETLTAVDGVPLAFRRYAPHTPRAALLFYHGGGAHSGAGYQHLGHGLQTQFNTLVVMPDIRGHGASGGLRGDAPSPQQVWADITTFIQQMGAEYPELPLFLGGHSSGAALALNYACWPAHEAVAGYVFVSPQLGSRSQTERPAQATPFAVVDTPAFVANAMSGGATHGHDYAVRFNYPASVLAADPGLVSAITVNMSNGLMPAAPQAQFAALDRPFGLWIGAEDELFVPDKVLAFAELARPVQAQSQAASLPHARHLSILVKAHETIGPWLAQTVSTMQV